jgi:hypothetical protein
MIYSLLTKAEVEKSKQNEAIIRETAGQVIKDFSMFGMDIGFPEDIHYAYDDLFEQLKPIIAALMQSNPEKLSALLYQIDLDEKRIRNPEVEIFREHEWIAELILEREFMKVLTRYYFRQKK